MKTRPPLFKKAMKAFDAYDDGRALRLMRECAEAGDPVACYEVALFYRTGVGTPVDHEQSSHWIQRLVELAEDGNLEAQAKLSGMLRWGDLLPVDIERANYWLERAAEGGWSDSQHDLASYYEGGHYGYPLDPGCASSWYERAFEQEHPETLYMFAIREFKDGQPTERAIELLRKAADKGLLVAKDVLNQYLH